MNVHEYMNWRLFEDEYMNWRLFEVSIVSLIFISQNPPPYHPLC